MGKNSFRYIGIDFVGHRNGRLTVIAKADKGRSWWVCQCDCGNIVTLQTHRMLKNKSCGCLEKENRENLAKNTIKHGMTETRLYSVWCGIKDRCTNPNIEHYDRYGGRGIKICDEWKNSFEAFRDWAYSAGFDDNLSGKEQSIDRINVNGDYEPSNCKWSNVKEQMRNRTDTLYIEHNGNRIPIRSFCEDYGITYEHFVIRHLSRGFTSNEILRIWNFNHGKHEGYYSMSEAIAHYGVGYQTIINWINSGKIKAEKVGISWFVPHGQSVKRREDRDSLGRFLPANCVQ